MSTSVLHALYLYLFSISPGVDIYPDINLLQCTGLETLRFVVKNDGSVWRDTDPWESLLAILAGSFPQSNWGPVELRLLIIDFGSDFIVEDLSERNVDGLDPILML